VSCRVAFCGMFILATALLAEPKTATVSSSGPVRIGGIEMSAASVAFWPLANGDVIETFGARATVILADKSRVTINPSSRVRLETVGQRAKVRVLSGSVDYDLASPSSAASSVDSTPIYLPLINAGTTNADGSRRGNTTNPATAPVLPNLCSNIY
jgi:FecR protein